MMAETHGFYLLTPIHYECIDKASIAVVDEVERVAARIVARADKWSRADDEALRDADGE